MKGVAKKIAIVTGGASGIGRALCEELARRQAVVIVAALNGEEASRVAQALADARGCASAVSVDVARADSLQELVRGTLAKHGRIDLMFNNAGIGWSGDFQEMALAHSDRVVGINLNGVLHGASAGQQALPFLAETRQIICGEEIRVDRDVGSLSARRWTRREGESEPPKGASRCASSSDRLPLKCRR